uniref:Uncharacterized protein n=1 Tax=Globodera rostochiensis TaxID=31243 RepID=A0A914GXB8_GLORO
MKTDTRERRSTRAEEAAPAAEGEEAEEENASVEKELPNERKRAGGRQRKALPFAARDTGESDGAAGRRAAEVRRHG